ASTPGELAPETTRVLPAMPFHPPSITAEESVDEVREAAAEAGVATPASDKAPDSAAPARPGQAAPSPGKASSRPRLSRTQRTWLAVILGVLVLAAAAAAVMMSISARPADVVPYPTVTGVLGEHLQELQKSVAP
ncbi:MAG: serine/threonine protein kinase, partial [Actinomycetes bacterium]